MRSERKRRNQLNYAWLVEIVARPEQLQYYSFGGDERITECCYCYMH